ncbi:MAG: NAD(P)H-hydrate epimerase, partial [Cytophagales bacterium]|nr:NAD(P)H-hydrate epimerase [Cytophagales bacterium]
MKIFTSPQIQAWDKYTIANEPISSVDLMERASLAFSTRFTALEGTAKKILIFCGPGNNGGDGLAIGRHLHKKGYSVSVFTCTANRGLSADAQVHWELLNSLQSITHISSSADFPVIQKNDIVIDALFGTGVTRPLEGIFRDLVAHINQSLAKVYAVDIASGLYAESPLPSDALCVKPAVTLTFQCPKLALLLPENEEYTGRWEALEIGLSTSFAENENTPYFLTTSIEAKDLLKIRGKFSHKGTHGHSLLWAGSYGKMGAAWLAAKAALRVGTGLLTAHIPKCGYEILQSSLPDAMVEVDQGENELIDTRYSLSGYKAIGLGPGIGQHMATEK